MDMFATKERKCILCQSTTQIYARFDYKLHVIRQHQTNIVHKNLFNVCKFTTSYTFCVKVAEKYTQYAKIQPLITHFCVKAAQKFTQYVYT